MKKLYSLLSHHTLIVIPLLAFTFFAHDAEGQVKISAPDHVCLGNLAYFKVSLPSGASSFRWDFGDGFSSVSIAPFHLYKLAGSFNVKVTARLANGSSIADSVTLVIDNLPTAILLQDGLQDSCLYTNIFRFKDQSTPAKPGQDITKRLVLWGDGDYTSSSNRQFNDEVNHHYKLKDQYKIRMEITDNRGCKGIANTGARVINGSLAKIGVNITYPSCGEAQVCFTNQSQTAGGMTPDYIWNFDSSGFTALPYSHQTCVKTNASKFSRAYLRISNPDNTCVTEAYQKVYLDADSISNQMFASDSVVCYGRGTPLQFINTDTGYDYSWTLNGTFISNGQNLSILPKALRLTPNVLYNVTCVVSKGMCFKTYHAGFRIKGPIARMQIFNRVQCGIERRVFFIDTSLYLNKKHAVYNWTLVDPEGDNCTVNRSQNINKYKNCNYAQDWFGKHDYTVPRPVNPIILKVTDTSTGCSDSTIGYVEHVRCRLSARSFIEICQYDTFLKAADGEILPKFFSLDTGRTWLKFPSQVPKPYQGLYGVGFIFGVPDKASDFGDDSIKVERSDSGWQDTVFAPGILYVKEAKNTNMSIQMFNTCKPYKAVITLEDSVFHVGDSTIIYWGDGTNETIFYSSDTIVTTYTHLYRIPGYAGKVYIRMTSNESCTRYKELSLKFGRKISMRYNGTPCLNSEICFYPAIDNITEDPRLYALRNCSWEFSHLPGVKSAESVCLKYNTGGRYFVTMYGEDSLGCTDTVKREVYIRQVKAGVQDDSKVMYCSELKQMFDSSYFIFRDTNDYISRYFWDFGTSLFTTSEKDPFKSFSLADSVIHAKHIIFDNSGCTDTVSFDIKIVGSIPKFAFTDTFGCAPFKVSFRNLSTHCASYIWEFDDDMQTTFENHDKNDVSYTYEKGGKFYPKLIGIDTFYNPYTGSVYYCNTQYDPGMAITVLETIYARLESEDTICLGQMLNIVCNSNASVNQWDFGDGTKEKLPYPPNIINHMYTQEGYYTIKVAPVYQFPAGAPRCLDSSAKKVLVVGVNADFDIDSRSDAPIFYFNNRSRPAYADLLWDFGQPSSGNRNTSTEQDPSHNYGFANGTYMVCLTASVFNKCKDIVCKPVLNDYRQLIRLYNVFTPGSLDSLNDEYDVTIDGESSYSLIIYDRWGVVVYKSETDGQTGDGINWNGRLHNTGAECSSGTYYYILNYAFKIDPDKKKIMNGVITLVR